MFGELWQIVRGASFGLGDYEGFEGMVGQGGGLFKNGHCIKDL